GGPFGGDRGGRGRPPSIADRAVAALRRGDPLSWHIAVELVHVVSAIVFAAGYISTNVLTALARETDDGPGHRGGLAPSGLFDRILVIPFGTLAGISGLILFPLFGYPVTSQWIWLSTLLYLGVIGLGVTVWRLRGERIEAAIAADDDAAAVALLRDQR